MIRHSFFGLRRRLVSYRRAVGGAGIADPRASSLSGRPALERPPRCHQRHTLGPAHRGTPARLARALPTLPDLPPAFPAVGRGGRAERDPSCPPDSRPEGAGRPRPLRVLLGRHLRRSEKGGGSVGKTKWGKGTKPMALAGASGLLLAVHAASA